MPVSHHASLSYCNCVNKFNFTPDVKPLELEMVKWKIIIQWEKNYGLPNCEREPCLLYIGLEKLFLSLGICVEKEGIFLPKSGANGNFGHFTLFFRIYSEFFCFVTAQSVPQITWFNPLWSISHFWLVYIYFAVSIMCNCWNSIVWFQRKKMKNYRKVTVKILIKVNWPLIKIIFKNEIRLAVTPSKLGRVKIHGNLLDRPELWILYVCGKQRCQNPTLGGNLVGTGWPVRIDFRVYSVN